MGHIGAGPHAEVRTLLAREVHDRIGGGLALALRRLELLDLTATGLTPADRERLAGVRAAVLDALGAARDITTGLRRPAPTAPPSLETALQDFLHTMAPEGLRTQVRVDGSAEWVPQHIAGEVFLIVREALRNALAHARPRVLTAHLTIAPHEVHAVVTDDGAGFDPALLLTAGGTNGLLGMVERARALGGTAALTSAPRRGTRVTVWVPIKENGVSHD
ncbi:ATP-binding protein [Streptomyces sp. NPDC050738]|uniref:sensor histidine kinase n=1 Tax=Streptomyces sp. NPDC050738 TaxID=3154744 RepID=UPI0034191C2F